MAVSAMRRLSFIGLEKDKKNIINRLTELGVVELSRFDAAGAEAEEAQDDEERTVSPAVAEYLQAQSRVRNVLEILSDYDERKKELFHTRKQISRTAFLRVVQAREELLSYAQDIESVTSEIGTRTTEINRLQASAMNLSVWSGCPCDLSCTETAATRIVYGTAGSADQWNRMTDEAEESGLLCWFQQVYAEKSGVLFVLVFHKSQEEAVMTLFRRYDCIRHDFQGYHGTPSLCTEQLSDRIDDEREEIARLSRKLKNYARYIEDFETLVDYYTIQIDQEGAARKMGTTKYTFAFEGWIPAKAEKALVTELPADYTCHMELRDPKEDEIPPTLLENGIWGSSVESVVKMYSTPSYFEYDPCNVAGFFYILFFGFMLSDAGYGLLLTIATAFLLKKKKLENSMRRFLTLFFFCGLSTVFWGALFGGWFGNLIETVTLKKFALGPIWFNPLDNPEKLLAFAILLGMIHVYAGLALKAVNLIRRRKWLDAVCDVGFWYIFFTGEALYLLPYIPYVGKMEIAQTLSPYGLYLLAAGFVLILFTKGRKAKNIFVRIFGGITCVYSLVDMLSDALSYSRLMAMGLATSVIINVFNEIAAMAGGLTAGAPAGQLIIGFIIFTIIFIVANAFNLVINALGSYVNSCRLMYIEFFGKFFEGDGKEFEPLRQNTEYILVSDEAS